MSICGGPNLVIRSISSQEVGDDILSLYLSTSILFGAVAATTHWFSVTVSGTTKYWVGGGVVYIIGAIIASQEAGYLHLGILAHEIFHISVVVGIFSHTQALLVGQNGATAAKPKP